MTRKFIAIVSNQQRFEHEVDLESSFAGAEGSIVKESKINWVPIDPKNRRDEAYLVKITEMQLQDSLIQLSSASEEELEIFAIQKQEIRPYVFNDTV